MRASSFLCITQFEGRLPEGAAFKLLVPREVDLSDSFDTTSVPQQQKLVTFLSSGLTDEGILEVIAEAKRLVRGSPLVKTMQIVVADDELTWQGRNVDALVAHARDSVLGKTVAQEKNNEAVIKPWLGEIAINEVGPLRLCFCRIDRKALRRQVPCEPQSIFVGRIEDIEALRGFLHVGTRVHILKGADCDEPAGTLKNCCRCSERVFELKHGRPAPAVRHFHRDVLIIGAGMAGAFAGHVLARRGFKLAVVDAGCVPGSGASALYAGLAHPHWEMKTTNAFRLTRMGTARLATLLENYPDCCHAKGVLDLAVDAKEEAHFHEAHEKASKNEFFDDLPVCRFLSADNARLRCGVATRYGGWWYEQGRLVNIGRLVRRLLADTRAPILTYNEIRLRREGSDWVAVNKAGVVIAKAHAVVAAAGLSSAMLFGGSPAEYGVSPLYGRISILRDTDCTLLAVPVTGRGYVARTADGYVGVGATYEKGGKPMLSSEEAHACNRAVLDRLFSSVVQTDKAIMPCGFYEGVRAVAKDRMPIAGAMVDMPSFKRHADADLTRLEPRQLPLLENAWGLFALGSRGLSWGLVLAEALAAQMADELSPLTMTLQEAVSPAKHALRARRDMHCNAERISTKRE